MQKEQIDTAGRTSHQGEVINMQLEAVTPEHGGSSLQLSTSQECPLGNQLQAANNERKIIDSVKKNTPSPSPTTTQEREIQTILIAKKRKAGGDEGAASSHPINNMESLQSQIRHNVAIPNIDIVA